MANYKTFLWTGQNTDFLNSGITYTSIKSSSGSASSSEENAIANASLWNNKHNWLQEFAIYSASPDEIEALPKGATGDNVYIRAERFPCGTDTAKFDIIDLYNSFIVRPWAGQTPSLTQRYSRFSDCLWGGRILTGKDLNYTAGITWDTVGHSGVFSDENKNNKLEALFVSAGYTGHIGTGVSGPYGHLNILCSYAEIKGGEKIGQQSLEYIKSNVRLQGIVFKESTIDKINYYGEPKLSLVNCDIDELYTLATANQRYKWNTTHPVIGGSNNVSPLSLDYRVGPFPTGDLVLIGCTLGTIKDTSEYQPKCSVLPGYWDSAYDGVTGGGFTGWRVAPDSTDSMAGGTYATWIFPSGYNPNKNNNITTDSIVITSINRAQGYPFEVSTNFNNFDLSEGNNFVGVPYWSKQTASNLKSYGCSSVTQDINCLRFNGTCCNQSPDASNPGSGATFGLYKLLNDVNVYENISVDPLGYVNYNPTISSDAVTGYTVPSQHTPTRGKASPVKITTAATKTFYSSGFTSSPITDGKDVQFFRSDSNIFITERTPLGSFLEISTKEDSITVSPSAMNTGTVVALDHSTYGSTGSIVLNAIALPSGLSGNITNNTILDFTSHANVTVNNLVVANETGTETENGPFIKIGLSRQKKINID